MIAWVLALLVANAEAGADCSRCHTTAGWREVSFDHDQTRLPLTGRHREVGCRACHQDMRTLTLDPACGSCHRDPHAGRLSKACERCHETTSFASGAGVAAHQQTRFPLVGRHAAVPCDQCHVARGDRSFGGVPSACVSCHFGDYQRTAGTSLDHVAANTGTECQWCHTPGSWNRGSLPQHEQCFPILSGAHRGIRCAQCHIQLTTLTVRSCTTFTAACTRCHHCSSTDAKHREEGVAGYQCADRKCYECHRSGGGGG